MNSGSQNCENETPKSHDGQIIEQNHKSSDTHTNKIDQWGSHKSHEHNFYSEQRRFENDFEFVQDAGIISPTEGKIGSNKNDSFIVFLSKNENGINSQLRNCLAVTGK